MILNYRCVFMGGDSLKKTTNLIIFLLSFIIMICSCTLIVNAANNNVDIEILNPGILETEPNEVLTISLMVKNKDIKSQEFNEDIIIPDGWNVIKSTSSFLLNKDQSDIRLISVIVPKAIAGAHQISYILRDENGSSYKKDIEVKVHSKYELNVVAHKIPDYVIAGEEFEVEYIVSNLSNDEIDVDFEVRDEENWSISFIKNKNINLGIGQSEKLVLKVIPKTNINKLKKTNLKLKAVINKSNNKISEIYFDKYIDIITARKGITDNYQRIPIDFLLNTKYDNNNRFRYLFQLSGRTYLAENKLDYLDLYFRSPEYIFNNKSISLDGEELSLDYNTENVRVLLGDNYYTLSPLTEDNVYGRGIYLQNKGDLFDISAYYSKGKYGNSWALGSKYSFNNYLNLETNYLNKYINDKDYAIWSLRTYFENYKNINGEFEYAWVNNNSKNNAWRMKLDGDYRNLYFDLELYNAEPDYPEGASEKNNKELSLKYPLIKEELFIWADYNSSKENLYMKKDKKLAIDKNGYKLGFTHKHKYNGSFSYSYDNTSFDDRFRPSNYNLDKEMNRISLSQALNKSALYAFFEWGKNIDRTTNIAKKVNDYGLNFYYHPNHVNRYKLYYYKRGNNNIEDTRKEELGINSTYTLNDEDRLTLGYSRENKDEILSNVISVSLNKDFTTDKSISIKGIYKDVEATEQEYTISFSYLYKNLFGIPIGLKNVGSIYGRIYDLESPEEEGVEGVIIRINDIIAVTNENGEYLFPSLVPGNYHVNVDKSTLDKDKVISQITPFEFSIEKQEDKELDFGIVRSAKVTGNISKFEFLDNLEEKQKFKMQKVGGASNILIKIEKDLESYSTITDEEGYFEFIDLRPGKWVISILETSGIPDNYHIEKSRYVIDVKPGENENVSAKLVPKKRKIKLIEDTDI
ncbi:MAG: hypothetical protein ACOCRK_05960 [bacterium]